MLDERKELEKTQKRHWFCWIGSVQLDADFEVESKNDVVWLDMIEAVLYLHTVQFTLYPFSQCIISTSIRIRYPAGGCVTDVGCSDKR